MQALEQVAITDCSSQAGHETICWWPGGGGMMLSEDC